MSQSFQWIIGRAKRAPLWGVQSIFRVIYICRYVCVSGEKTKTGDSYQMAHEERKTSLEKMVATELLKLAMETDEERKARLKKMVATTQLRLAPETEDERRARLEYQSINPIYIPNNL